MTTAQQYRIESQLSNNRTFAVLGIARFNFTWAMPDGAWLETPPTLTSDGMKSHRDWFPFSAIRHTKGQEWIDRQLQRQGWMTGCWIDVTNQPKTKA